VNANNDTVGAVSAVDAAAARPSLAEAADVLEVVGVIHAKSAPADEGLGGTLAATLME
jgi:TPP-dependent 2-oxoacid decarboxylase